MSREIETELKKLLEYAPSIRIPRAWLQAIPNHTLSVLLADILSSYLDALQGTGHGPALMDGDELLLEYKRLAKRLGLSDRSISRGVNSLERIGALRRTCRDRTVNGKPTRNVVGVVPNLKGIEKISGITHADKLSAPGTTTATPRRGNRNPPPTAPPAGKPLPLTANQESLSSAYKERFLDDFNEPYRPTPQQGMADNKALASIRIKKTAGVEKYVLKWHRPRRCASRYLATLKAKDDHGDACAAVFDQSGYVKNPYTIEAFVEWAGTDEALPNGLARRSFR